MKKELQAFSDGAKYFGNPADKIIGPTPDDIRYFNSLPSLENGENRFARDGLVAVSSKSQLGELLNFALGKVPKPGIILPATLVFGLIAGACPADGKDSAPTVPGIVEPQESPIGVPEILPEGRFLDLPFPPDPDMHIQQAWTSDYDPDHHAMDIIKGNSDDSSTWKSFPVLAGADGKACKNPPSSHGNAVRIEHNFDRKTIFEYIGHLESIEPSIPDCGQKTIDVKRGEKVGMDGATGVVDKEGDSQPNWKHIHWRIFDANNNSIDPFDISGERQSYPNINDPRYKNGKFCGPKTILIGCPTETAPTVSPRQPTPTPQENKTYIEVRYADGQPVKDTSIDIYTQEEDINGNPILKDFVTGGSTGSSGAFVFSENLEEFIVVFPNSFGLQKVYGEKIDNNLEGTGIEDAQTESSKNNTFEITLGRIIINIKDDPLRPAEPFFQTNQKTAETCILGQDETEETYRIKCIDLMDLRQPETLNQSRAIFNLLPGEYTLQYIWGDATNGWKHYFATVGNTQVVPGQTTEFYCLIFAPSSTNNSQPADCSLLPQ